MYLGNFVLYRRIVEELLRLADDTSGAADIDVVRHSSININVPLLIKYLSSLLLGKDSFSPLLVV